MGKYRSLGLLIIALLFSGGAAFLAIQYLDNREKAIKAEIDKQANYVDVVVPTRDLAVGDVISVNTVAIRQIPEEYIPDGVVLPSQFDAVAGLSLIEPAKQGRPIIRAKLDGLTGVAKFSELLNVGERALTLPIDALQATEYMLQPGDRVDILVKKKMKSKQGGKKYVSVSNVLSDITILATGITTIADPMYGGAMAGQGYGSITIGVANKKIPEVLAAQAAGELVYLLKNPEDKSRVRVKGAGSLASAGSAKGIRILSNSGAKGGVLGERITYSEDKTLSHKVAALEAGRLFKKYDEGAGVKQNNLDEEKALFPDSHSSLDDSVNNDQDHKEARDAQE